MTPPSPAPSVADPTPERVRRSRRWVLLLVSGMVVVGFGFVATATVLRDRLRERGGPLQVGVRNESAQKYRVDLYVGETVATFEMDPGESGTVRFNPKEPLPVLLRVFEHSILQTTMEEGRFEPGQEAHVEFVLQNAGAVRVSRL